MKRGIGDNSEKLAAFAWVPPDGEDLAAARPPLPYNGATARRYFTAKSAARTLPRTHAVWNGQPPCRDIGTSGHRTSL
jgi:hypothetical protein